MRALAAEDVTTRDGIPVTTVTRTLVDLAGLIVQDDLERAVNEADVLRALDVPGVLACAEWLRGRRGEGHAALEAVLALHHGPVVIRSRLEWRFRALVRAHGLLPAEHNVRVGRWEVDALWRDARVAVELDSARFHDTLAARTRDARKTADLEAAGWTVRRYRSRHLTGAEANATAAELRTLLTTSRPSLDAMGDGGEPLRATGVATAASSVEACEIDAAGSPRSLVAMDDGGEPRRTIGAGAGGGGAGRGAGRGEGG